MKNPDIHSHAGACWIACLIGLAGLMLIQAGCRAPLPALTKYPDLLAFIADGKTTKVDVLNKLGPPTGTFQSGKVVTYRVGYSKNSQECCTVGRAPTASGWPTWDNANYSLVLVFDDAGILRQHSLVTIYRWK